MISQWIITIIVSVLAFGYALFKIFKLLKKPTSGKTSKADDCEGCSSNCNECPLKTDMDELLRKNRSLGS
ncbi:MAG: FeoB-associated Cys-rich membrane protein [Bacteroidota bacterium]